MLECFNSKYLNNISKCAEQLLALILILFNFILILNVNTLHWEPHLVPALLDLLFVITLPHFLFLSPGESGAEPVQPPLTPDLPVTAPSSQSQTEKDAYS